MSDSYSITIEVLPRSLDINELTVELDGTTTVNELMQFTLATYPTIQNQNCSTYTLYSQAKRSNFAQNQTISEILGSIKKDKFSINTALNAAQPGGQIFQTNSAQMRNSYAQIQQYNSQQQQPSSSAFYANPNSNQMQNTLYFRIIYYQYYNMAGQVSLNANSNLGQLYQAIQSNLNKQSIEIFLFQQNLRNNQPSILLSQLGMQNGSQVVVQDVQQVPQSDVNLINQNQQGFNQEIMLQFQVIDGGKTSQYKCKFKMNQQLKDVANAVQQYLGLENASAAIDIYLYGEIYNKKMDHTLQQLHLKDNQVVDAKVRWIGGK